ncbi:MAG TPA: hypothetical protein VM600_03435 [Actinomycetota bacterium]|nr:hypothetical protein [Actinomycetota bacterium]
MKLLVVALALATAGPSWPTGEGQPTAEMVSRAGSMTVDARSYCAPRPGRPAVCVDSPLVPNPTRFLRVEPFETVTFRVPHVTPRKVRLQVWKLLGKGQRLRQLSHGDILVDQLLTPSNAPKFRVSIPRDKYVFSLGVFYEDRDAAWIFGADLGKPASNVAAVTSASVGALLIAASLVLYLRRRREAGAATE